MGGTLSIARRTIEGNNKPDSRKSKQDQKDRYTPSPGSGHHAQVKKKPSQQPSPNQPLNICPLPPVPPKPGSKTRMKALYNFNNASSEELNFKAGDIMEILEDDGDWWRARNVSTKEEGYIPKNYFGKISSLDEQKWYHGPIDRKDSEKLLQGHPEGTFMVRVSGTVKGSYTISIVDSNSVVKHYRVKTMDNGEFYLNSRISFKDLPSLVKHYGDILGLCSLLTTPCPKLEPVKNDLSRSTRDKWEIDRSLVELKDKIGTGNFGEVWKGIFNKKIPVAVKIMKEGSMQRDAFLQEAKVMKELRHPKLVKLFAVCSSDPIYIITELMTKGCLQHFLRQDAGRTLTTTNLIDFGAQIASGMQFIEAKNCVHRDLAARNILVSEHKMLKIGDFGLTRHLNEDIYIATIETKFPVRWTAPEVFNSKRYCIKSDVWAFGILLIEIFTFGETPYPGMSNIEVQTKVSGTYRHPKPNNCSQEMYELIFSCWKKVPEDRPTFDSLFNNLDDFIVANELAYL